MFLCDPLPWKHQKTVGFPKWGRLVGDNFSKMIKNYKIKITKSKLQNQHFGGTKLVGHGGDKPIFLVVGGSPSLLPLRETLKPKGFLMFSGG